MSTNVARPPNRVPANRVPTNRPGDAPANRVVRQAVEPTFSDYVGQDTPIGYSKRRIDSFGDYDANEYRTHTAAELDEALATVRDEELAYRDVMVNTLTNDLTELDLSKNVKTMADDGDLRDVIPTVPGMKRTIKIAQNADAERSASDAENLPKFTIPFTVNATFNIIGFRVGQTIDENDVAKYFLYVRLLSDGISDDEILASEEIMVMSMTLMRYVINRTSPKNAIRVGELDLGNVFSEAFNTNTDGGLFTGEKNIAAVGGLESGSRLVVYKQPTIIMYGITKDAYDMCNEVGFNSVAMSLISSYCIYRNLMEQANEQDTAIIRYMQGSLPHRDDLVTLLS